MKLNDAISGLIGPGAPPLARQPGFRWSLPRAALPVAIMAALALVPLLAELAGQPFYITLVTRILIFALAATGLNLVLGYGGMISMGHALYIGVGAYAVGILSSYGVTSGWIHLGAALACGGLIALLIGAISLRTSGVGYIMITLAFAQMLYFLVVSLRQFGGDDGLPLASRSDFSGLPLSNPNVLYYLVFVVLAVTLYCFRRLVHARFGMLLRGAKCNPRRMAALGFPLLRYRLLAYVISAQVCVIAGLLMANLTNFVSPSYMHWAVSGELLVMVVLGGLGTLMGPVVGALCMLILEEVLSSLPFTLPYGLDEVVRSHWLGLMGLFIIVVTLALRRGLYGALIAGKEKLS
ncbi:branched-chain amino acid ABC transporter permease [Herbaspirillum autotrophicum]|uniref:branched-chain amino acid ABC transporter permease n=1 Tax=Herbaspirillum autotrophicum TaxID=180195 RepID=UPI0009FA0FEB|nr:branched-chain amino acid ABC transporter permease [Herbaspirillum autotrophicum]